MWDAFMVMKPMWDTFMIVLQELLFSSTVFLFCFCVYKVFDLFSDVAQKKLFGSESEKKKMKS